MPVGRVPRKKSHGKQEAKLMEHAGLVEKLTMQREGNVLRQWERHQRDWLRVAENIVAKTGKVSTIRQAAPTPPETDDPEPQSTNDFIQTSSVIAYGRWLLPP